MGFYITAAGAGGVSYTDGNGVGTVEASDGTLQILEGVGKAYPFGSTNQLRIWNGSVLYTRCDGTAPARDPRTGGRASSAARFSPTRPDVPRRCAPRRGRSPGTADGIAPGEHTRAATSWGGSFPFPWGMR